MQNYDIELVSVNEYLERKPEKPDYIVEPLLVPGSVMMLYGSSGVGKTSVLYQLARSIAEGEDWLGFKTHQTGPVLFLELDMNPYETHMFLGRAEDEDLRTDNVITPYDDIVNFDIMRARDREWLREQVEELEPAAVIVDTVEDAYATVDITPRRIKKVLNGLQRTISPAATIFTRHTNKNSKWWRETKGDADPLGRGGFSGFDQWEQAPTAASAQLAETIDDDGNKKHVMKFHKTRLGTIGFEILPVEPSENYFFYADFDYRQLIANWPRYKPQSEQDAAVEEADSIVDVCVQVGKDSKTNPDTVRKHYYRAKDKGVTFDWEKTLEIE